jgi:hypothetical protein
MKLLDTLRKMVTSKRYGDVAFCIRTVRECIDQKMAEDVINALKRNNIDADDIDIIGTGVGHIIVIVSTTDVKYVLGLLKTCCTNRNFRNIYAVRDGGVWKTGKNRELKNMSLEVDDGGKAVSFWYGGPTTIPAHITVKPDMTRHDKVVEIDSSSNDMDIRTIQEIAVTKVL